MSKKNVFLVTSGNTLEGEFLGIYACESDDGPTYFYKVRSSGLVVVEGVETRVAGKGSLVYVPRFVKTRVLDECVETLLLGGKCDVKVECKGEISLSGGKKVWDFAVASRMRGFPSKEKETMLGVLKAAQQGGR